jgi:hypothetical protein
MSKAAADFITKLSTDPDFRTRFRADPDKVMDEEGLSPEDKEVLKSEDPERIRKHLGDDAAPGCYILFL